MLKKSLQKKDDLTLNLVMYVQEVPMYIIKRSTSMRFANHSANDWSKNSSELKLMLFH